MRWNFNLKIKTFKHIIYSCSVVPSHIHLFVCQYALSILRVYWGYCFSSYSPHGCWIILICIECPILVIIITAHELLKYCSNLLVIASSGRNCVQNVFLELLKSILKTNQNLGIFVSLFNDLVTVGWRIGNLLFQNWFLVVQRL